MGLRCPAQVLHIPCSGFLGQGRRLSYTEIVRPRSCWIPLLSSTQHSYIGLIPARALSISGRQYDSKIVVRVPQMAESTTEGVLSRFNKQVGDFVEQDEELATIETGKIDISVNAPQAGLIQELLVGEGDTVTVEQAILELHPGTMPPANKEESSVKEAPKLDPEIPQSTKVEPVQASTSTPPPSMPVPQLASTHAAIAPQSQPCGFRPSRREERVKMARIRQRTAQRLKESQNTAAFLTTFNEVDMSRMIEFRKKNKDAVLEKHGVKLGFMGCMARASALALKEIPSVNSSMGGSDTIIYRDYVDLSVAAAIPKGLVTPILRNIESMSVVQIEKGIAELVKKARDGKLTMNDLSGGTFTISNSGIWGSLFGTPILNTPQTAVLGMYGIQDRPVAVDGQVEIRPMMYLALTYDHRIIDGREAVNFLNLVKNHLQEPETMLLSSGDGW